MCQVDIYNFMRNLRKSGDDNFYTTGEITGLLTKAGITTNKIPEKVTRLWWYGFFQKADKLKTGKEKAYNRRLFRAKL